jgi:hypothetical protein
MLLNAQIQILFWCRCVEYRDEVLQSNVTEDRWHAVANLVMHAMALGCSKGHFSMIRLMIAFIIIGSSAPVSSIVLLAKTGLEESIINNIRGSEQGRYRDPHHTIHAVTDEDDVIKGSERFADLKNFSNRSCGKDWENASTTRNTTTAELKRSCAIGRKCRSESCQIVASYGNVHTRTKEFCKKHCREDDVLLTGRKCEVEKCSKQASFGAEGDLARRCSVHRLTGHVAVFNRCSGALGCVRIATFGDAQSPVARAQRCSLHTQAGDIRITGRAKAVCKQEGCKLAPSFGYSRGHPLFCKSHAKHGCFNAKGHKRCSFGEGCNKIASFGDAKVRRKGELFCAEVSR